MKNYCMFELAALAALTFASCSSESVEDLGGNQASQQVAIGFDGYLGRSAVDTRGSESTTAAIQAADKGFGVFGNYTASDETTPTYGQNLFVNQPVTYSSAETKWTYSPVKYWPTEGHIDFLAYAPYDKAQKKLIDNKNLVFTVNSDVTKQIDLLWANAANKTKASGKVNFTFNHALAKIGYSVKSKDNYDQTTITVKSIKLVGSEDENTKAFYTKGVIDLSKANGADALWKTVSTDTKQNFDWFSDTHTLTTTAYNNPDANYLFVIPQDFSKKESNADKLYVIVEYTISYNGVTTTMTNKVYKQLEKNFEQGKAYMINLIIGLTPIEFEAKVDLWPTAEDIDVSELN